MKLSRIPAVGAAIALVATSTLFVVSPASADDFFYDQDDFGQELPGGYPVGFDWFYGDQPINPIGDLDWTPAGIEINNGTNPSGAVQILNQNVSTPAALGLALLVDVVDVIDESGQWTFQLPLFANPAVGPQAFTTLRPQTEGIGGVISTGTWITSQPIPTNAGGVAYAANDTATLVQFEAALNALDSYELLAFGLNFTAADTDTIHAISWESDWNVFTPQPTGSVTPVSLSVADFTNASKGVTATVSGFLPGESTFWWLGLPDGDYQPIDIAFADVDGVATMTYVAPAGAVVGEYSLWVDSPYLSRLDEFTFVESFFDVTANVLAATGVDAAGAGMVAGILLITGLGVMVVRRRADALR